MYIFHIFPHHKETFSHPVDNLHLSYLTNVSLKLRLIPAQRHVEEITRTSHPDRQDNNVTTSSSLDSKPH